MIHIGKFIDEEVKKQRFTPPKIAAIIGATANGVKKQLNNPRLNTEIIVTYCNLLKYNIFYKLACSPEFAGYALPQVEDPLPAPKFLSEPNQEYKLAKKTEGQDDLDLVSITITLPRHKSEKIMEILKSK